MIKHRILELIYNNGTRKYKVQENLLFGLPLFWTTVTYWGPKPPHPDLAVPGCCTVNCVFSTLEDAKKCLIGLSNKNSIKIICKKVIK